MKRKEKRGSDVLPKRGRRFSLLYQWRLNDMVFWPTLLIGALSAMLISWGPPRFRGPLTAILFGGATVFAVTLLFRLRAYAQCRRSAFCLQLPFSRLEIPYRSIRTTRPTDLHRLFPPQRQRWTERRFLKPLFGRTVVVVELEQLPAPRRRLRLWMSKYMLSPDTEGLVLLVEDWIALRSELDEYKARSHHTRVHP
jgi:hypothetical protein